MRENGRHFGFSLLEVMFAVVILTLGLIFVASYFPLGLSMTREIAQGTQGPIRNHNAAVLIELRLEQLVGDERFWGSRKLLDNESDMVFPLSQPNVRIDSDDIVMDDVAGVFSDGPPPIPAEYDPYSMPGYIPLWLGPTDPYLIEKGAIGLFTSPGIGETDREVRDRANELAAAEDDDYDATDEDHRHDYLQPAIYEVALQQNAGWLALAQCLDLGGRGKTFKFSIFELNCRDKKLRYGMQNSNSFYAPEPVGAVQDRLFPTAWLVTLYDPVCPHDANEPYFTAGKPKDRFVLNNYTDNDGDAKAIAAILRDGTPIVNMDNGRRYEIADIEYVGLADGTEGWQVKLDRDLEEDEALQKFWLVPPAIKRSGDGPPEFADRQPVLSVTEVVISF